MTGHDDHWTLVTNSSTLFNLSILKTLSGRRTTCLEKRGDGFGSIRWPEDGDSGQR